MKVKFDENKCVGCYACHTACLDAHYQAEDWEGISRRTVKRKEVKIGYTSTICPGCTHCGKCIEVCPTAAVSREKASGIVLADDQMCTGCMKCVKVCPSQVIKFTDNKKIIKCDGCIERVKAGREPACVRACPVQAIKIR